MDKRENILLSKLKGIKKQVKLAPFTTFKIGGPSKYFITVKNAEDLINTLTIANKLKIPIFLLGNGSNVLISDNGFDGLTIKNECTNIKIKNNALYVESGAKLQKVVTEAYQHKLTGLECLVGIPGTIGGAIINNAGASKNWIGELVEEITAFENGKEKKYNKEQSEFSYRTSIFKNNNCVVLDATFLLTKSTKQSIDKKIKAYNQSRKEQPKNVNSAGSIFKNPPGHKAWKLVDEIGFRGKKIGGAKVDERHANFIVNTGTATAEDVIILISYIKQQVRNKLKVQLQEEIRYIGF